MDVFKELEGRGDPEKGAHGRTGGGKSAPPLSVVGRCVVVGGRWLRSKQLCCVALVLLHVAAVNPCSSAVVNSCFHSVRGRWKVLPFK